MPRTDALVCIGEAAYVRCGEEEEQEPAPLQRAADMQQPHTSGQAAAARGRSSSRPAGLWHLLLLCSLDQEILCNALACAGASMSDPLMSMVDSYYAGKLGTTSLAALGSNGALFSVLYFVFFTALAVLCTQTMAAANSRGDAEACGRGFIQAVAATLCVGAVLVVVLLTVPESLLGLFHTEREVMALAKTYCMIRALSLPAALIMNVSQAAFRSLLDLTTPFCVVMTANAANYALNHLLMVVLPYGMAGCGWASVVSQYTGALLFAGLIYRRRYAFGIPEALAGAVNPGGYKLLQRSGSSTGSVSTSTSTSANSSPLQPPPVGLHDSVLSFAAAAAADAPCGPDAYLGPMLPLSILKLSMQKPPSSRAAGPFGNVNSSSTLIAVRLAAAAGVSSFRPGSGQPLAGAALDTEGSGTRVLDRWESVSKFPGTHPLDSSSNSAWWRLGVLLRSLDWASFTRRFAGMMTRGGLILSCYTSANVVAAMEGAATMAAHHVLQQQLQLQMSFAWSFLHIGQSMTANLFHSSAPGAGPKAARVLSSRIIAWGVASSTTLALGTYACRHALPSIFTSDPEVTEVVLSAALPAAAMLSLACNSALEGCLLAADEQAYVIRMYPWAVGTALLLLGAGYWSDAGLPGVWLGLMAYYLVLLVGFAARYWLYRGRL